MRRRIAKVLESFEAKATEKYSLISNCSFTVIKKGNYVQICNEVNYTNYRELLKLTENNFGCLEDQRNFG